MSMLKWAPRKYATCQEDANQIAAKFLAAGSKVKSASCVKDHGHVAEISIYLDNSALPEIYSALFAYRLGPVIDSIYRSTPFNHRHDIKHAKGYFRTLGDCLINVPNFEQMFRNQSGLEPIASQCIVVSYGSGYALQIDGLGEPVRRLNRFEQLYFNRFVDDVTLNRIKETLASTGFQIIDSRWIDEHFVAIGWGEPKLTLNAVYLYESNFFATTEECLSQKDNVTNSFLKLGRTVFHAQCETNVPRPRLLILEEGHETSDSFFIDVEKVGRFGSMSECMNNLDTARGSNEYFCSLDVGPTSVSQGYRLNKIFARQRTGEIPHEDCGLLCAAK